MTFGVPDHIRSNYRTLLPPVEQAGLLQSTITTQLVCRDVLKQYNMAHLYIFFSWLFFMCSSGFHVEEVQYLICIRV
jgi:hypothetical protein